MRYCDERLFLGVGGFSSISFMIFLTAIGMLVGFEITNVSRIAFSISSFIFQVLIVFRGVVGNLWLYQF